MSCNHSGAASNGSSCQRSNRDSNQAQRPWIQRHFGLVLGLAIVTIATALTLGHHWIA